MNSAGDLEDIDPKMKDEEASDEVEATSEEDNDSEEDDVQTIARIQKTHYAQTAAMARNRRPAPIRQRRMSQKRKMEAVKSFHDFTKKLKKDTGIAIRSIVGNSILDFSDGSSEEYQSDSDGLSEEDFVVDPAAVNDLNEENESYIDPETGDFVEGKKKFKTKSPTPEPEVNAEPKTLTISDLINEDLDLSKNVEISEVDQGELCPEKTAEDLLGLKQEEISQDSDLVDKLDDGKDTEGNAEKEEDNKPENDEEKKAANPNAINVRRNIRDVMDEKNLDASTLAAQRQESERLARVQEQQRIIREVQRQIAMNRQNKIQQKTISHLQGGSSLLKKALPGQKLNLQNTVLVKLPSGEVKKTIVKQGQLDVTKISKPTTSASAQKLVKPEQKTDKKEVVEIVDSSSGDDSSSSSSDSDDCIMLSDSEVPPSPEAEDDPGNSGLHVNDTYNIPDEQGRVLINIGHPENEEDIFLAPQISRIIKPHQIGGVRFLFDNIIESTDRFSTSTGFGCILAHSMGLGKTLQIVCFCDIFLRHTKSKTVLCIMPINTLQNWVAEFNKWLPFDVVNCPLAAQGEVRPRNFPIYVLNDSHKTLAMRAKVIKDWTTNGGVLMIGYELYRLLSMKKDKKPRKKRKADTKQDEKDKDDKKSEKPEAINEDTQSSDITNQSKQSEESKQDKDENGTEQKDDKEEGKKDDVPYDENKKLLDEMYEALVKPGPDLVICDEGHRIKNSHSNISYALKQMRTKRRVVLTGYPLQNNLLEYWCMVDFVRPNYLGSKTEFCNMFERPIQNGQCIDSTPQDIRLMRYRAHVLHSLLVGFVQRRSHAVLQSTLPQKEEYVLLIRMTPLQRKLYDRFMNEVVRSTSVPNPLKAFAICCKIWNHPDVLYHFLRKRSEASAAIEEDLDLDEISGTTRTTRSTTRPNARGRPGRRPGRQRGPPKKPEATIPPNQSGPPKSDPNTNYNNTPIPYGPNYNQNPDRSYNQYGNYPNQNQGYYPPNQQYNQNFTNNYYQQQPYGNNYPNQYPPNNTEQYNNQNYWGNGYYGNQGYYNNQQPAPQYPNSQQPAPQYPNSQQPAPQYPNNQQPAPQYPNSQPPAPQYPNNQQPAAPYPNSQPPAPQYPNNQQPAAPYPNNQQALPQYPNNQQPAAPYPNNQQPAAPYPNNQQLAPQYPGQQYPPNYNGPPSDPNYQNNAVQPYQQNQDNFNNQQPFPPSGYQNQQPGYQNPPTYDPNFNANTPQEYPQQAGYTQPYPTPYPTCYNPPYDPQSQSSFTGYQGPQPAPNPLPAIKAEPTNYPEPSTTANPTQPSTEYPNQGYYNNTNQFPPQPTNTSYQYDGYQQTPLETKPPLSSAASGGSVGSPLTSWPIVEALKTEGSPIKYEEKTEIKSESDSEVKIADLDTKKIVDETKKEEKESPVKKEEKTEEKDGKEETEKKNSDGEEETPKKGKRGGRAKKAESKRGKNKPKAKGRKDRKNSKEKDDSDSEESEKEEKPNREEEYAIMKKAEEVTYDWAAELLKDYLPGIIENSAKMQIFFYILNESIKLGDRVLLFSQSLFTLNLIEDFLERNYIPRTNYLWKRNTSYYRLDGSTHALEREKLINEFNANPHVYLFLVSTRAGSLGINLVGANRVIVFDASWNPCHDTQAVCRVYRYGQRKPCFVYRFVMDFCLEKKIYDRQINKQGMADRVVDECNPDAVLSMKEITNLCFDNDEKETEAKDLSEHKDKYIDVIMQSIIGDFGKLLSKEPFQHESLLVDRKEKKLSSAEKRLAQRGYELEKKAASAPRTVAYRTVRAADGSLVQRPVASVRPMQHAARWIPADVWRRQGMTAQEMTLPLDVVIPTNSSEKTNIVLKAGQRVMVLKSPKGIYMQLESGKIIAIKTSLKGIGQKPTDGKDPKKMIANRPASTNLPGSLKNNSAITITSKSSSRPIQRVIRPPMSGQNRTIRPFAPGQKLDMRQRMGGDSRMFQGVRKVPPGRIRPNFPGSLSITKIMKDPKKTDNFKKEETNTDKTDDEPETQVLDSDEEEQKPHNNQVQSSEENTNDSTSSSGNKKSSESDKSSEPEKTNDTEKTNDSEKNTEDKPIVLTTEEKLPDEAFLDNKPEVQHPKSTDEIQHSPQSHSEHPEKTNKVNLLKNYRHQRLAGRSTTESSLSQLEKTAISFNTDVMPAFRKNLDTITQSYTPNTEEKPVPKPRKKKANKAENETSSAMSHSVSSLLGVKETSSDLNASPVPPNLQARLSNPMHSAGQQGAFGPPMDLNPMMGIMDPGKVPPMPLPPTGAYAVPGLPPEAPFGQYPPPPPNYGYGYPPSSGYYPPYLPPSAPDTHWYPHQGT